MIADLIASLVGGLLADSVVDRGVAKGVRAKLRRLQADGILMGTVRAVDGGLGRFGDMPLSAEWHVSPGLVRVGSTRIVVTGVDEHARAVDAGEFLLPAPMTAVALTVRGPGPTVEIAMAAESEAWFRDAVRPV